MWHAWEHNKKNTTYELENQDGEELRHHNAEMRIILKLILKRSCARMSTGLIWLRIDKKYGVL